MEPEDLMDLMRNRRTVRDYLPREIDEASLQRIVEAGTLPPSGADKLPFIIIKVTDRSTKENLRYLAEEAEKAYHENADPKLKKWFEAKNISHEKDFLTKAPALLVVAGDTTKPYWRESTWLSIGYMVLEAEAEGLGTVTYTPSETQFLNDLLDIPISYSPEVILPLGHPVGRPPPKEARPKGRVFSEKFS